MSKLPLRELVIICSSHKAREGPKMEGRNPDGQFFAQLSGQPTSTEIPLNMPVMLNEYIL